MPALCCDTGSASVGGRLGARLSGRAHPASSRARCTTPACAALDALIAGLGREQPRAHQLDPGVQGHGDPGLDPGTVSAADGRTAKLGDQRLLNGSRAPAEPGRFFSRRFNLEYDPSLDAGRRLEAAPASAGASAGIVALSFGIVGVSAAIMAASQVVNDTVTLLTAPPGAPARRPHHGRIVGR